MLKPKTETPKGKPAEQTTELWGLSPQEAIYTAAAEGDATITQECIDRGAKVNSKNEKGMTPIMDVGASDRIPSTPEDQAKATRVLIQSGANIHAQDGRGVTPLMWAVRHKALGVMQELLDNPTNPTNKANPNDPDREGRTALMYAARDSFRDAAKMLIDHKADVNAQDKQGRTALMYAVEAKDPAMVKLLLENDADINVQDANKQTALHRAVEAGDIEMGMMLVENKANVNIKDKDGNTALMKAIENGDYEMAHFLIEHGADVDIKNKDGKSAHDLIQGVEGEEADALREDLANHSKKPNVSGRLEGLGTPVREDNAQSTTQNRSVGNKGR